MIVRIKTIKEYEMSYYRVMQTNPYFDFLVIVNHAKKKRVLK
jgi:hypothetical protein